MKAKSKFKGLFSLLIILLAIFTLTGCSKNDNKEKDDDDRETASDNVKSDGYEKFSQLKIGMTESEVNAILGDPIRVDKAYYYYNITVNGKDLELTVWINLESGTVTNMYGKFYAEEYRAEFADKKTDLSSANDLESGKIATYDDCVSAFKTPGYLISIDDTGETTYLWVDSNDGYMTVTFREDGTVKKYSGFC